MLLKNIFSVEQRGTRLQVFREKGNLSISQNLPENICVGVLSFSEIAGQRLVTLLNGDSSKGVFLLILQKKNISRKSSKVLNTP